MGMDRALPWRSIADRISLRRRYGLRLRKPCTGKGHGHGRGWYEMELVLRGFLVFLQLYCFMLIPAAFFTGAGFLLARLAGIAFQGLSMP